MGLTFTTKSPAIDEEAITAPTPSQLVQALSREKALAIAVEEPPDAIVIGADTVVALEDQVLGKPSSPREAEEMLASLSGRSHTVYTGVTVCRGGGQDPSTAAEATQVTFRALTPAEIRAYVATGEPMDKAGAYGIQGLGALLVEGIQGDYSNVVGLPIQRLGQMLLSFGVDPLASAGKDKACGE
jgi:septum formation protein